MPKRTYPRIEGGTKYGRLTVLEYLHNDKHKKPIYKVLCDCGTEFTVSGSAMKKGNTTSCGCFHKEVISKVGKENAGRTSKGQDLLGQNFGELLVLSKEGSDKRGILWKCSCTCGNIKIMPSSSLAQNKSCGCLRTVSNRKRAQLLREQLKDLPDELRSKFIDSHGYVRISGMYHHPNADKTGGLREHTYIMSQILGRPLLDNENVHHKNGVRHDNRPENLELWVKFQPPGQRVEDLVEYAKHLLTTYSPESLCLPLR